MSSAVVIGASDLLSALVARAGLDDEDALTFADTEPLQALQAINDQRPRVVILERLFAATSRGAALINRLKSDPALADLEIRVLSHSGDYSRVIARPAPVPVSAAAVPAAQGAAPEPVSDAPAEQAAQPLDWHGTRRAPRFRVREGIELQLDGNPVTLIDISIIGAQVLSPAMVRPDQRVRVTVPRDDGAVRFRATIAWARFELPRRAGDPGPHYRAGVEFLDADAAVLEKFCEENQV
jgi:CheY-like chemotaxis protein